MKTLACTFTYYTPLKLEIMVIHLRICMNVHVKRRLKQSRSGRDTTVKEENGCKVRFGRNSLALKTSEQEQQEYY